MEPPPCFSESIESTEESMVAAVTPRPSRAEAASLKAAEIAGLKWGEKK